jgi:hypothetical protein
MAHKVVFTRGRIEFKVPPGLAERATREAVRLGLSLSAFIRLILTQHLERAEAEARRSGGAK